MAQMTLEHLLKIYQTSRETLLNTILQTKDAGAKAYANTLLKQVNREIKHLAKASSFYTTTEIPKVYNAELNRLYKSFNNRLNMLNPEAFADLHEDAIRAAAQEMNYQIGQGVEQAGRRAVRYITDGYDDALRMAGLEAAGEKFGTGGTLEAMRQNLVEKIADKGLLTVQYGEGPGAYEVALDSYAAMVARTTTREVGNTARLNQLEFTGHDLVKMTEHYPTCPVCAALQGRVYSISGQDKRFPPLSVAFKGGYKTVHPNCRHSVVPWIESMQTDEEIAAAIEKSNKPFEDSRDKREIDLYNEQQAKIRQAREALFQYERYKARLGDAAPKSYSAFKRVKNNPDKWAELQRRYRIEPIKNKIRAEASARGLVLGDFDVIKGVSTQDDLLEFADLSNRTLETDMSFAAFQKMKYFSDNDDYAMRKGFVKEASMGNLPDGYTFKAFDTVRHEAEGILLNQACQQGYEIKHLSPHFVARLVGQTPYSTAGGVSGQRMGIDANEVLNTLQEAKQVKMSNTNRLGQRSFQYESDKAKVIFNVDYGILISANPMRRKGGL